MACLQVLRHLRSKLIETFLENGARLGYESERSGQTLLHAVAHNFHVATAVDNELRLCDALVLQGANLNAYANIHDRSDDTYDHPDDGRNYMTPVQEACGSGSVDLVEYFVEKDPSSIHQPAHAAGGRTSLQAACEYHKISMDLVEFLLGQGVDPNEATAEEGGITALQGAARNGHLPIAIRLIDVGAEVDAVSSGYWRCHTAVDFAALWGRPDMVKMLINAGAKGDTTRQDNFHAAISLAKVEGHLEIVELLEEAQRDFSVCKGSRHGSKSLESELHR